MGPRLGPSRRVAQALCLRFDPTLRYLVARAARQAICHQYMHDWASDSVREVDWLSGACLVARREAIDAAGLLDENIFMYFEDNDWCLRMRRAGWQVVHDPGVAVLRGRAESGAESGGTAGMRPQPEVFLRQTRWPAGTTSARPVPDVLPGPGHRGI